MVIIFKDSNHQYSFYRYVLPFLFIMLIGMIVASQTVIKLIIKYCKPMQKIFVVLPLIIVTLIAILIYIRIDKYIFFNRTFVNRYDVGAFLPKNLSLMSGEVSQMFYARENRNVIDSWTFTNRDILKNNYFNSLNKKCWQKVYWSERFPEHVQVIRNKLISANNPDIVFVNEFIFPNPKLMHFSYESMMNQLYMNLNDTDEVNYVKNNYKIVFINHIQDKIHYFLLVKNNKLKQFNDYIIAKGGKKKPFTPRKTMVLNGFKRINFCDLGSKHN